MGPGSRTTTLELMGKRNEFNAKTKALAAQRAAGHCENCGRKLLHSGDFHYDHIIPCALDELGGDNSLENCRVLCTSCHMAKTGSQDIPRIAKASRNRRRNQGIRKPRKILAWRKFDGTIVRKGKER